MAYCYFSGDGYGSTFLSKEAVHGAKSIGLDLTKLYTKTNKALIRWKLNNGKQTESVITQLDRYSKMPLGFKLDSVTPYNSPQNIRRLGGGGYLMLGLINVTIARHKCIQGLKADGKVYQFRNCDANPNSYFAFFTRKECGTPIKRNEDYGPGTKARRGAKAVIKGFLLPDNYFCSEENHFGGCGGYSQTGGWRDALGSALGLPFS